MLRCTLSKFIKYRNPTKKIIHNKSKNMIPINEAIIVKPTNKIVYRFVSTMNNFNGNNSFS